MRSLKIGVVVCDRCLGIWGCDRFWGVGVRSMWECDRCFGRCGRAIAFGNVGVRSLLGDVGSAIAILWMWVRWVRCDRVTVGRNFV